MFAEGGELFRGQAGVELIEAGSGRGDTVGCKGVADFFEASVFDAVGGGVVLGGDLEAGVAERTGDGFVGGSPFERGVQAAQAVPAGASGN